MSNSHRSSRRSSQNVPLNNELSRLSLNDEARRTRHRASANRQNDATSNREYLPNGVPIFTKLNAIELLTYSNSGSMSEFVTRHFVTCRVYYAYLFHVRLIQARIDAGVARTFEVETIQRIDDEVHINSLPVHTDLVDTFRLNLPAVPLSQYSNGLHPMRPEFPTYDFCKHKMLRNQVSQTWFPTSFAHQPSIRTGINYLRWLYWKKNSSNDDQLPSTFERLDYLAYGVSRQQRVDDSRNDKIFTETLQCYFTNPMFLKPLPNSPGVTQDALSKLTERSIPPPIGPVSGDSRDKSAIMNELLFSDNFEWLNHAKYVISTLCHITDQLSHFSEVNQPYTVEELNDAVDNINHIALSGEPTPYSDARAWMTIFNAEDEYQAQTITYNSETGTVDSVDNPSSSTEQQQS
jgi:hypothetical protein